MTAVFTMRPVPPFRLDLTVWALRRLPSNAVDLWDGTTYRRVLTAGHDVLGVGVAQTGTPENAELHVTVACDGSPSRQVVANVSQALSVMLGLDTDLAPFYRLAAGDRRLDDLVTRFRGVKPPRFASIFEGLVNGIACQQLSLNVGIGLLNKLCAAFGPVCGDQHAFPRPQELAAADSGFLRSLGFSTRKAENIVGLARSVDTGELRLESLEELGDREAENELDRLRGVGRWTAEYVALRSLGRLDVFPADDVGGQNKITQWLGLDERPGYDETNRWIAAFSPYRGLIYFHLLLNTLAERGLVSPGNGEA